MEILLGKRRAETPAASQNDAIVTAHGSVRKGMKLVP